MTIPFDSFHSHYDTPQIRNNDLDLIICIPAYKEGSITAVIESIFNCDNFLGTCEIYVLINEEVSATHEVIEKNIETYQSIRSFSKLPNFISNLKAIYLNEIPKKIAGVGMARKIIMDLAYKKFELLKNLNGIIICLDADCTVSRNYLNSIFQFFAKNPKYEAASIFFEHTFDSNPNELEAIIDYELHLRYFVNMQRLLALPFAFQTVGSAMAVQAIAYKKEGGMNKRKAGEDFYFMQKYLKKFGVGEINSCTVFPSSRVSDRVPFGTGRAVAKRMEQTTELLTYNPLSFSILSCFIADLEKVYYCDSISELKALMRSYNTDLLRFLQQFDIENKIFEIKKNTNSYPKFLKRFYSVFDAFQIMKYLHFMRDYSFPNIPISEGISHLFKKISLEYSKDMKQNLSTLRKYDRLSIYTNSINVKQL